MENFTNTIDRIKYYIDFNGLTVNRFSSLVGLSNSYLGKMFKDGKSIGSDKLEKILRTFPDINPSWLLTGKGLMLRDDKQESKSIERKIVTEDQPGGILVIPIEAMAGWGTGELPVMDYETSRYVIPEFEELHADFLIRVKGGSMYPKYSSGDLVACRKIPLDTFFQWNKVYVLDTCQGAMIKRLHKSDHEGEVICVSDNPEYPPFELPKTEIYSIAIVVGVIRME